MALLRLQREPSDNGATLGALYLNDVWQCWTLEDVIRETPDRPSGATALVSWVHGWKVAGKTAIPAGRYDVVLTTSVRFGIVLPELIDVPGFAGIRIHGGNRSSDTEGCLLVGQSRLDAAIGQSQAALSALLTRLRSATASHDRLAIDIYNPPAQHLTLVTLPPETRRA